MTQHIFRENIIRGFFWNRVRGDLGASEGDPFPPIPKSRGGGFHGRAMEKSTRDPGLRLRAMARNAFEINKNERAGSLRFSLWKPSPFLVLLLWHQPTASEFRIEVYIHV